MARSVQADRRQVAGSARAGVPVLRVVEGGAGSRPARAPARAAAPEVAGRKDALRLGALAAALTAFGLVMILSASPAVAIADYGSPWALFERQFMWILIGAAGFAVAARLDLVRVRRLAVPALVLGFFLLVVVLAPHIGKTAGGSSRWIGAGPVRVQPSELMKLAFAVFAADLVARREHRADHFASLVRPLGVVLAAAGILILKQPDMGTAIVLVCIGTAVLFAAGVHGRMLAGVVAVLVGLGSVVALAAPYRRARLLSFINPFAHASGTGYQVVQSLSSLGSGHLAGAGIGAPFANWFLPNAQTDFIFAVVGNDLGFVGAVALLLAFAAFGWLGIRIAARTEDRFASLLVTAITCWVVFQALINVGGVIGILPETGIPLPFLSFGGSSLVVVLIGTGLLVNIARRPRAVATGQARQASAARRRAGTPERRSAPPRPAGRPRPAAPAPAGRRNAAAARLGTVSR
ncbi:MAG TPA: putative lipid II flippase FtsW [Acidimicrobiales bacterium]|nr:putative lipid II flippase FtsW [Acidimicrobiales bacterium]